MFSSENIKFDKWIDNAIACLSGAVAATLIYNLTESWVAVWVGIGAFVIGGFMRQVYLWRKKQHKPVDYYKIQD